MGSDKTAVFGDENEPLTEEDIVEMILSETGDDDEVMETEMPTGYDEVLDDLRGDNPPTCKACGVAYIDHIGHEGLCNRLQAARAALEEISCCEKFNGIETVKAWAKAGLAASE